MIKSIRKTSIMIQARLGSKRFPKKVIAKIENHTLIWHIINRIKQVNGIEQIVLLTTNKKEDETLLKIAKHSNIIGFVGDENNVLNRYYNGAIKLNADPIIRITGDCPLVDSKIIEKMLKIYLQGDYDYVTNTLPPTFPDGLDVEIISLNCLKKIHEKARSKSELEHVTSYIRNHSNEFKIFNYKNKHDLSNWRLTVDEKMDLKLIRKIYSEMKPKINFDFMEVQKLIEKKPELLRINKHIKRNEGYNKSQELDTN